MQTLTCYACGTSVSPPADPTSPAELPAPRCSCGEPRWFEPDADALDATTWPTDLDDRMWAFPELLPVSRPPDGFATAPGGTPLVRTPALDEYAGARVTVKDEGRNPTGSFKDRGSVVGVALAAAAGADAVGTVSHGNMAMSTAAAATAAGLDCVVCVPADISEERLRNISRFGPRILRIEGDYGQLYHEALAVGRERGVPFINSDTPGRVAGQKTTALETLAEFRLRNDGEIPDAVVCPVSSGGHASGAYKGLQELADAGLLAPDEMPRLFLVQAAACAPIARADERGLDAVERVEKGDTVAYSIANPDPPSGTRALWGARETGGGALAVDDEAILDAKRRLAADAGLTVEASSATALAGVRRLTDHDTLGADDDVVCIATGSGFKEFLGDAAAATTDLVALDDLASAL
ncbi:threonine synthase [Halorubrum gandharaense]